MAARVTVGRFGAPHGVRGEIRLQSFTADPLAIAAYGPLSGPDGRVYALAAVRRLKDDMLVVRVAGVDTREAAQALTHVELGVDRAALPPPDEDEFYIADLVGLDAIDGAGQLIGTIVDVPNYGGGDLVEVRRPGGGETLLFPFTNAVVPSVDIDSRRVTIVPPDEVEEGDEPDGGSQE